MGKVQKSHFELTFLGKLAKHIRKVQKSNFEFALQNTLGKSTHPNLNSFFWEIRKKHRCRFSTNWVRMRAIKVSGPPSDAESQSASFRGVPGMFEARFASKIKKIIEHRTLFFMKWVHMGAVEVSRPPSDAEFRSASFQMGPGYSSSSFCIKTKKQFLNMFGNPCLCASGWATLIT